jgi:hypothetical protein
MKSKDNGSFSRSVLNLTAILILFALVPLSPILAQNKSAAARSSKSNRPPVYSVASGNTLRVRLNKDLDSENARPGDTFTATVVDPVYSKGGVLVVPQASTVTGSVTSVARAGKGGQPASMNVQFIGLRLPNGVHRQINGSLTDLAQKRGESDNEGGVSAQKTKKRSAKFIGGGAAGGALIGAIAGGGKGALIGGGIGAATGLIGGKVKKGNEVKVKSGTEFGIILNRSLSLPKYGGSA